MRNLGCERNFLPRVHVANRLIVRFERRRYRLPIRLGAPVPMAAVASSAGVEAENATRFTEGGDAMLGDKTIGPYGPQLGPGWEEVQPGIFVRVEPVRLDLPAPEPTTQTSDDPMAEWEVEAV